MRILLAMLIAVGLMLNSGNGVAMAACAKASTGGTGHAHAHPMASHHTMHAHSVEMGNSHKLPSKCPGHGCKCCEKNTKCTHESCACLKCFNVFADVQPVSYTGVGVAALLCPDAFDKPPGNARQPPPPPPQS